MKYLKRFNEDIEATIKPNGTIDANIDVKIDDINTIYDKRWQDELSEYFTIKYHDKLYKFKKDNIMLHSDMVQITYASTALNSKESGEIWGVPDTLEIDIYFVKNDKGHIKMTIDITYGDAMVCEFTLESPNKIKVVQYTSHHSKFDPSNTVFAFTDGSLESLVKFLNMFSGMKLKKEDFKFLDQYDDYSPN